MKKYINAKTLDYTHGLPVIHITMYLHPIIYVLDKITATVSYNKYEHKYHTDVNPYRCINGPLSGPGEQLESPILNEWNSFIDDCKWLVNELGFTIICTNRSITSQKSEYMIIFGMDDDPCGTIIYDLRLSDHPFDATFPEDYKDQALEYMKMENILDGTASKEGIDFQVEQVLVGSVTNDSWDKAFNRVYDRLKRMRNRIRKRLKG